ncbi:MAG TPA: type II toxin-antitoxin system HicA family toxin [Thermoanaerobaculia bacterium]|jgi:predicted RNA binding protein YcfA (HicA-like mRNA interferase family)
MAAKLPIDAPKERVVKALEALGFTMVRDGNHIAMIRENVDGTTTPLTMPNHRKIKSSTLRTMLTQARIPRQEFLKAYEKA